MNLSLIKIQAVFPDFNIRPITTEDFWRVVRREKIVVRQMPLMVDGYYTIRRNKHYILINSKLTGVRWLHTALHELHHFLFDVPGPKDGRAFYRNGEYIDRREYRADAFALIGVLPWPDLLSIRPDDVDGSPWLAELVHDRITVRTHFGI